MEREETSLLPLITIIVLIASVIVFTLVFSPLKLAMISKFNAEANLEEKSLKISVESEDPQLSKYIANRFFITVIILALILVFVYIISIKIKKDNKIVCPKCSTIIKISKKR